MQHNKDCEFSMLEQAIQFATKAHGSQIRKYTGEPYITHPIAVATAVEQALTEACDTMPNTIDLAMIVAVLHDTVEDTKTTIEDIERVFGAEVAQGVWFLSDPPAFVGNRKTRKALTRARLAEAPSWVKAIKIADLQHNAESIEEHDPEFFKVFVEEAMALMGAMCPEYM